MPRPNLFIIGAPKSGTTSLYEYLAGHPEIYMSPYKEPMFFCPDVHGLLGQPALLHGTDEDAYLALFDDARSEKWLGEATTRYLVSHQAARLVHEFSPDAVAICLLRNPVELVHALHNERVSQGNEPITDFAQAIAVDERRARGVDVPGAMNRLGSVYRESARFAEPLQRWFDALGQDRVHVVIFDDLTRDVPAELRRTLEFLGVDPDYQPANVDARNASHRQRKIVRRVLDSRLGTIVSDDMARALLGANARARLACRFRKSRLNRRGVTREPLPEPVRRQLDDEFRPDVEQTGKMLGRDLAGLWFS